MGSLSTLAAGITTRNLIEERDSQSTLMQELPWLRSVNKG